MSGAWRCPRCRRSVPDGAAFCPACGASVADDVVVEVDGGATGPAGPTAPARRRSGRIGLGVAVALAVAIGASIASGGGDDRTAPTTSSVTVAATSTTTVATPTTDAATTSSTPPQPVGPKGVPLLGEATGFRLLLASNRGLYRLDLDAGTLVPVEEGGFGSVADDMASMRGGYVMSIGGELRFVATGASSQDAIALPGQLLGVDPGGRAYVLAYGDDPFIGVVDDATATFRRLTVPFRNDAYPPTWLAGGELLLAAPGGVFAWSEAAPTPRPVAAGAVVDATGGLALVRRCWPEPACRYEVVDTATGAVVGSVPAPDGESSARLSPDGGHVVRGLPFEAVTARLEPVQPLAVVSVAEGTEVRLETDSISLVRVDPFYRSGLAWTPDGRWLFYVRSARTLSAWRDGLDAPIEITIPDVELRGPVAVEVAW